MKVGILAGGFGSRLQEETVVRPKPMVEIGGQPILWHIMRTYAAYGFKEFVVAVGYKSEVIKDFFVHYRHRASSLTVCLASGGVSYHGDSQDDWKVHILDTGVTPQTGGRVKRIAKYVGDEPFMLTYGDGVSNVNIHKLLDFHKAHGKLATVTAVRPPARFGGLKFEGDLVAEFMEKPQIGEGWINGGFFVLEPEVANYIEGDDTYFEHEPLEQLARERQLVAYRHDDFWQCMDTVRDLRLLERLWSEGRAPWKISP